MKGGGPVPSVAPKSMDRGGVDCGRGELLSGSLVSLENFPHLCSQAPPYARFLYKPQINPLPDPMKWPVAIFW